MKKKKKKKKKEDRNIPGKSQGSHLQTSISRMTWTSESRPLIFNLR